jgi:S-adenosylmethionine hydrolase
VIVALLTDFGTRDHYVGTMKGVILSVCPEATLVDITHDIPAHDIVAGALELAAAYRYFPAGTVFVAIVDPGVGSDRRGIAADAGGYRFVGPDNGLLSLALRENGVARVVELCERKFARPTISRTFEGRDRFAPAAGWLARGTDLRAFGPLVLDPLTLDLPRATATAAGLEGEVVRVDRFGNLITNIDQDALARFAADDIEVQIQDRHIARIVQTYGDVAAGDLCALVGSSGHLEIAQNSGNAADALRAGRGAVVRIVRPWPQKTTG